MAEELLFFEVFRRLVFGQLRYIGMHDLKVLLVILQHRNSVTGYAWPSLEKIARLTTGSKSSVIAALKRLEARGLIKTVRKGGGRRQSTYRIITFPEVPDEDGTVPVVGTESDDEKTVPRSTGNGTTLGGETVPRSGLNGTTLEGQTVPVAGTRINESTEIKESQSKHSDQRDDGDQSNPSGFDFDWETELAEDKAKHGSPYNQLTDLDMSEAAAANTYKFKGLGRALAQVMLDHDQANLKSGMYPKWDRASYLGKCCWHPKPEIVNAARRLRREWAKAQPKPKQIETRTDAKHGNRERKRILVDEEVPQNLEPEFTEPEVALEEPRDPNLRPTGELTENVLQPGTWLDAARNVWTDKQLENIGY